MSSIRRVLPPHSAANLTADAERSWRVLLDYCASAVGHIDSRSLANPGALERHAQQTINACIAAAALPEDIVKMFRAAWTDAVGPAGRLHPAHEHAYTIALGVLLDRYFKTRDTPAAGTRAVGDAIPEDEIASHEND